MEKKEYEIWVGYYHFGQGSTQPTEPQLVESITATSFKLDCVLYEHKRAVHSILARMDLADESIHTYPHVGIWNYNPRTNSNSWTGSYFETREEALTSFPKPKSKIIL